MQRDLSQWIVIAGLMNYDVQKKKKKSKGFFFFLICDTTKFL